MAERDALSSESEKRSHLVKAHARALGFDACGIADAREPIDPEDHLGVWLRKGYHAAMAWMARTKEMRRDVRLKLPGAQSVIVAARNYYAPRPPVPPRSGAVARYAWGRDYHRALGQRLERLAAFLGELEPGVECYASIDSGPVLERAWAAKAGLGWIGKNSLVLRQDMGSWFFLATIITTMRLEPDPPTPPRCGTCTACIDACPTQAIAAPGIVDSRRCISYHTIENRGEIPAGLHKAMGRWVFGCDICQEVCPWNQSPRATDAADFHPRPGHADPGLDELAAITETAFNERFQGTPIRRAKHAGIRRNAQIALGNMNSE